MSCYDVETVNIDKMFSAESVLYLFSDKLKLYSANTDSNQVLILNENSSELVLFFH